jgi:hypothetical protein
LSSATASANFKPPPDHASPTFAHISEIDGDHYEYLAPAAEALSERHPLAATLVLRAMIDFTLTRSRAKRYRYAAEHLVSCARLAREIPDFSAFETHDAYVARLKEDHGRKFGFWSLTAA